MGWRRYILMYPGVREDWSKEDMEWDGTYSIVSRFKKGLE